MHVDGGALLLQLVDPRIRFVEFLEQPDHNITCLRELVLDVLLAEMRIGEHAMEIYS